MILCSNRWLKIEVTARQKSVFARCRLRHMTGCAFGSAGSRWWRPCSSYRLSLRANRPSRAPPERVWARRWPRPGQRRRNAPRRSAAAATNWSPRRRIPWRAPALWRWWTSAPQRWSRMSNTHDQYRLVTTRYDSYDMSNVFMSDVFTTRYSLQCDFFMQFRVQKPLYPSPQGCFVAKHRVDWKEYHHILF